jgi:hypothetical protein
VPNSRWYGRCSSTKTVETDHPDSRMNVDAVKWTYRTVDVDAAVETVERTRTGLTVKHRRNRAVVTKE